MGEKKGKGTAQQGEDAEDNAQNSLVFGSFLEGNLVPDQPAELDDLHILQILLSIHAENSNRLDLAKRSVQGLSQ